MKSEEIAARKLKEEEFAAVELMNKEKAAELAFWLGVVKTHKGADVKVASDG